MDRVTINVDDDLGAAVRAAAAEEGVSVSGWFSEAAAARLRNKLLGEALDQWEAEHGHFSDEELQRADELLRHGGDAR